MNFLVTGGAGFIGSHVCERLLQMGHSVWALDDLNAFYDPALKQRNLDALEALGKPFTFVKGDITYKPVLDRLFKAKRFDQIIHLAARAGVRPSLVDPALYQRVNVEGTVKLLEAARVAGVKKVTIASSSSVYGVNAKVPFSEDDPIFSAISPYAASKLACEALGHVYHHVYGMDVVMLRFLPSVDRASGRTWRFTSLRSCSWPANRFLSLAMAQPREITPTSATRWTASWP